MDVRRVGVPRHQLLERLLRGRIHPRRREVAAAAGQHHDLPLRARYVRRQQRHPHRRDAERLDDTRAVVGVSSELAKDIQCLLVVFDPVQQDRRVIADDAGELLFRVQPERARADHRPQRVLIVLQLKVTQPLECPRLGVVERHARHAPKCIAACLESIEFVVRGAEIPVAFGPRRLQLDGLLGPAGWPSRGRWPHVPLLPAPQRRRTSGASLRCATGGPDVVPLSSAEASCQRSARRRPATTRCSTPPARKL